MYYRDMSIDTDNRLKGIERDWKLEFYKWIFHRLIQYNDSK